MNRKTILIQNNKIKRIWSVHHDYKYILFKVYDLIGQEDICFRANQKSKINKMYLYNNANLINNEDFEFYSISETHEWIDNFDIKYTRIYNNLRITNKKAKAELIMIYPQYFI